MRTAPSKKLVSGQPALETEKFSTLEKTCGMPAGLRARE